MNRTAYLVAFIDTDQSPPVVVGAGIFSESARAMTHNYRHFPFDVLKVDGNNYEDAARRLLEALTYYDRFGAKNPYGWVRAFMKETSV